MIKLIALLSACIMMLSGCGCSNDTNNDGIVGNDETPNNNTVNNNTGNHADDNLNDDAIVENNHSATDTTGARSSGMLGRAVDDVGNAVEDIGRGANNVMHDVGNAMR